MYTVLIQSQKTLNDFGNFRPLMADSMKNGVVVECRWEESGRTLETALPDLFRLVQDKKEWRAVIICTQPSDGDGPHPASKFNPYDYLENAVEETPDTVQAAPKMKVENGEITGIKMRVEKSKLTTVRALQSIGFDTIASGDSYNDLDMILASKAGFLFRSTEQIKKDYPQLGAFEEYDDLLEAIKKAMV